MISETYTEIEPFIKWAGGKRWLLSNLPELKEIKYNRYIEPFFGGGALFFHLKPSEAIISDINPDLIDLYKCVRDDYKLVYRQLEKHQKYHSKEYYYQIRDTNLRNPYTRASKFLYLNKAAWNGLYRVNLDGKFNVPVGSRKNVMIDFENLSRVAQVLKNAKILNCDFESVIDQAMQGDLLYVDPPYTVKHNHNGFIRYNESIFSWKDQERLHEVLLRASRRKVKILLSNASHQSIRTLYENDFDIYTVKRPSMLAANSKYRGEIDEYLITKNIGKQA